MRVQPQVKRPSKSFAASLRRQSAAPAKRVLDVGVFPDTARYENGQTVDHVAKLVEYGAPTMRARPFMLQGGRRALPRIRRALRNAAKNHSEADWLPVRVAARIREMAVKETKDSILRFQAYDTGRLYRSIEGRWLK